MLIKSTHTLGESILQHLPPLASIQQNAHTYKAEIRRSQPSAMIFLLDQSGSMSEKISGKTQTKAQFLAQAVNLTLAELINVCTRADGVRAYFDIALIGYGGQNGESSNLLWEGQLANQDWVTTAELAAHPKGIETIEETKIVRGSTQTQTRSIPTWVAPVAEYKTPMGAALEHAYWMLHLWIQKHPQSYPPVVLNFTDGAQTDCSNDALLEKAKLIKSLHTEDGSVLLFNCHISDSGSDPIYFPANRGELPNDDYARILYDMSSDLPDHFAKVAAMHRSQDLAPGATCSAMIYQADAKALFTMLQVGTRSQQTQLQKPQ